MVSISNVSLNLPDWLDFYRGTQSWKHELFSRGTQLRFKSSGNRNSVIEMRLCLTREVDQSHTELHVHYQHSSKRGRWKPFAKFHTKNKIRHYIRTFSLQDFMGLDFVIIRSDFQCDPKALWFLPLPDAYKKQIVERLWRNYVKVYADTILNQPIVLIELVMSYVFGEKFTAKTQDVKTDRVFGNGDLDTGVGGD